MLNLSPENAHALWLKTLQRFIGIGVRVRVREFSTLQKEQLPDVDDRLLSLLTDDEVHYGLKFNNVLRRSQWAEGARSRLEIIQELGRHTRTSTTHSIQNHICRVLTIGAQRDGLLGVGADLEPAERPVLQEIQKKFLTVGEPLFGLTTLQLWCIKEAAWKSNPARENTVLSQYRFQNKDAANGTYQLDGPDGFQTKAVLSAVPGWLAAFAASGL